MAHDCVQLPCLVRQLTRSHESSVHSSPSTSPDCPSFALEISAQHCGVSLGVSPILEPAAGVEFPIAPYPDLDAERLTAIVELAGQLLGVLPQRPDGLARWPVGRRNAIGGLKPKRIIGHQSLNARRFEAEVRCH